MGGVGGDVIIHYFASGVVQCDITLDHNAGPKRTGPWWGGGGETGTDVTTVSKCGRQVQPASSNWMLGRVLHHTCRHSFATDLGPPPLFCTKPKHAP